MLAFFLLSLLPFALSSSGTVLSLALCQSGSSNDYLPVAMPIRLDPISGWFVNGASFNLIDPIRDFMTLPTSAVRSDAPTTIYYFIPSSNPAVNPPQLVTLTYTGSTYKVASTLSIKSTNHSVSVPSSLAWMIYNPSLQVLMGMGFQTFCHIDPITGAFTPFSSLYPSFSSASNLATFDPSANVIYTQVGVGNGIYQSLCGYPDFKTCIAVLSPKDGSLLNVYQHQIESLWMSNYLYPFSSVASPQAAGVTKYPLVTTIEYIGNGSVKTEAPFAPAVSYMPPAGFDLFDTSASQYGMLYYINGGMQTTTQKVSYQVNLQSGGVVAQATVQPSSLYFYCASETSFITGPVDVLTGG